MSVKSQLVKNNKILVYQSGISLNLRTGSTGHATLFNQWEGAFVFIKIQIKTSTVRVDQKISEPSKPMTTLTNNPYNRDRGGGGAGRAAAPPLFCAPAPTFWKSNTMILFLFSIFNMKKLFSIVSPPTFHLAPRPLYNPYNPHKQPLQNPDYRNPWLD